jgi:hypothetical protein
VGEDLVGETDEASLPAGVQVGVPEMDLTERAIESLSKPHAITLLDATRSFL